MVPVEQLRRSGGSRLLYTGETRLRILRENGITCEPLLSADHHRVSMPRPRFLDPATRRLVLERYLIVTVRPSGD